MSAGQVPVPGRPRLRAMRSSDLAQVLEIEEASFATPWSSRTFLNLLRRPNAALFAAEEVPGRLIGFAVIWFAGPEGELGDLAVRSTWRRRGVASALIEAVVSEAAERGASEIYLEVRESNEAARGLYARHGFQIVNQRPQYYSNPVEDALVMRLIIVPTADSDTN